MESLFAIFVKCKNRQVFVSKSDIGISDKWIRVYFYQRAGDPVASVQEMNMTEDLTEDVEEVKIVEVKRGRGRPKIPDELKKTKPKVYSGLPRGRPRLHSAKLASGLKRGRPRKSHESPRLKKIEKKPKVLEINIGDKAQISLIKDFTNDDLLDVLPVKFVTKSNSGLSVKKTQQIKLMVIKPTNGKLGGRTRNHVNSDSDYSDDESHSPSTSKSRGQPSTSKGRGRPRKYLKESVASTSRGISRTPHISYTEYSDSDYSDDESHSPSTSKSRGQLSTSKGRGRPRKYPRSDSDYSDDESHSPSTSKSRGQPSTSKGRGRPRKNPKSDSDYSDDESHSPSTSKSRGQPSTSKGRGRPRKYPKIDIDDDSAISMKTTPSSSKGRGRPRIHPKVEVDNTLDDSHSLSLSERKSKGRGRPRKHAMKTISSSSLSSSSSSTGKGRGRPRKHSILPVSDTDSGIHDSPSTSKGPGRPRKYPEIDTPIEDKPKKGRGRPRKFRPSKHTETTDKHVGRPVKLGRGRPRKEARVILETPNNREDNAEFESQINGGEFYTTESGVKEDNLLSTDDNSNCEDLEYSISLNSEQTDDVKTAIEDVNAEPEVF